MFAFTSVSKYLGNMSGLQIYILAFGIRIVFILWGQWQDSLLGLRYTDVDYDVLTDGARLIANGGSPFERTTYRYSPLLAWMMLPNVLIHPSCGKLLFSIADLIVGRLIEAILLSDGTDAVVSLHAACLWLLNPVSINISTRGSGDAVTSALVLLAAWVALGGERAKAGTETRAGPYNVIKSAALAALPLSLAVHLRLYPVIYVPAFGLHLGHRWHLATSRTSHVKSHQKHANYTHNRSELYTLKNQTMQQSSDTHTYVYTDVLQSVRAIIRTCVSPPVLLFLAVTGTGVLISCTACWWGYGSEYVEEALLYHVSRTDNRHNFSVYFYWIYLELPKGPGSPGLRILSLVSFLPQAVLLIATSLRLHKNLPLCLFVQTVIFVSFNKVCTGQYFAWYLSLFPLLAPSFGLFGSSHTRDLPEARRAFQLILYAGCAWVVTLLIWLLQAYRLEFMGHNTFFTLWLASLSFLGANVCVLCAIISWNNTIEAASRNTYILTSVTC